MSTTATLEAPIEPSARVLPPSLQPAMLRAPAGAEFLSISIAAWYRLDSAGKLPEGKKLGGCKVWSRVELEEWIAAGCPDRAAWNAMRATRETREKATSRRK